MHGTAAGRGDTPHAQRRRHRAELHAQRRVSGRHDADTSRTARRGQKAADPFSLWIFLQKAKKGCCMHLMHACTPCELRWLPTCVFRSSSGAAARFA